MIVIITGNQYKKYLNQGAIELPEIYAHQDEYIQLVSAFLIAGRTRTLKIITKDPALVESFDAMTDDNDGQVVFFVDDINEDKITKRQIAPNELYVLYDTMGRIYDKIDIVRLQKEWGL